LAQLDELNPWHSDTVPEFSRVRTKRVSGLAVNYLMLPEQHEIASDPQIFSESRGVFVEKQNGASL
jgi:hypothetical protein